jgi:hypothetical protein
LPIAYSGLALKSNGSTEMQARKLETILLADILASRFIRRRSLASTLRDEGGPGNFADGPTKLIMKTREQLATLLADAMGHGCS